GTRPLERIAQDTADALPSGQAARLVSRLAGAEIAGRPLPGENHRWTSPLCAPCCASAAH
ncbi:hypothetical protein ABZ726_07195, partial [Streptomyces hundungensis]|uniref:hypothetical protein n=1 Tax=Streptomyces hundungensis TaxID=1077946 RepID=UPI0033C6D4DC